ncbi:MAG: DUF937 domain-containing protein [Vicinamibacterales bacterium]
MNILDVIMNAQGGAAVRQLGSQVGLGEAETASALSALVPALAVGFQRNLRTPEGLSGLVTALSAGNHQRYIDDPAALADQAAVADGDGILGHVLGIKDVSPELARRTAAQTGLGPEVMKRMLPLAASLMMGAFAQQKAAGGMSSLANLAGKGGLMEVLTPLVDQNRDGSILDDVSGIVGRVLGRS